MADVQIALTEALETQIVASTVLSDQSSQVVAVSAGIQGPAGVSAYSTVAGTTYTLSESDRSKILIFTNSSDITLTVPTGLSDLFDVMLVQNGTGQITVSGAVGVTVNAALSATKTAYQYAVATLIPTGSDTFILSGEVTA